MITKEEIKNNINTEWHLPLESQKLYRYRLCTFILNVCQKIGASFNSCSLAMLITNNFFIKNLYYNYNKMIIACSAILLSTKNEISQNKFNDICKEYSLFHNKGIDPDFHKIREILCKFEILLMKQLNFNIPQDFPYDLIYGYSSLIYPNNEEEISNTAIKVANDSYFTYVNNIYKNYVVALACLVIAARLLDIPTILDENLKNINNMKKINKKNNSENDFERALIQFENKYNEKENGVMEEDEIEDDYFERLTEAQKLYPGLEMNDLIDCISMILEFYEDMSGEKEI